MSKPAQKALQLFHKAAREVLAYKDFLAKHHVRTSEIKTADDFGKVPVMGKKNYLYKYRMPEFFLDKIIPPMAYASSGSSGKPTFWFRGDEQEIAGGRTHEKIISEIFGINKKDSTLVIICFSMGVWVAGNYTLASCRYVSRQGYNLTTVTPGLERTDILDLLRTLAPQFKNVILAGYPPFIMDIVNDALRHGIKFGNRFRVLTAGDKFTEDWRNALTRMMEIKHPERSIVSIYGCAEAGVLGHETPVSVFIRKQSQKNREFYRDLFGEEETLPALIQYDPESVYFEQSGEELIFTTPTATPLIRYNIHDVGNIISHDEMGLKLKKFGFYQNALAHGFNKWKFPFIVKKGRTDVAVTFYALNIYPENLRAGIEDKKISKYLSGNFLTYNKNTKDQKTEKLYIKLELAPAVTPTSKLKNLITSRIINKFSQRSLEYRKLLAAIGKRAWPTIILTKNGHDLPSQAGLLNLKGKKPKMIL